MIKVAKYTVQVSFGGDTESRQIMAYSPMEAAFKAGALLAARIVTLPKIQAIMVAAEGGRDAVLESMEEMLDEDLSSVLVEEHRYAQG